jgi:hypothetical protein
VTIGEAVERASKIWGLTPLEVRLSSFRPRTEVAAPWMTEWDVRYDNGWHGFDANGHVTCIHDECKQLEARLGQKVQKPLPEACPLDHQVLLKEWLDKGIIGSCRCPDCDAVLLPYIRKPADDRKILEIVEELTRLGIRLAELAALLQEGRRR